MNAAQRAGLPHVKVAVAMDNIGVLAERVQRMLEDHRRITLVRRLTHRDGPPDVYPGLTAATGEPADMWNRADGSGFMIPLWPGEFAIGMSAYTRDAATEKAVWDRFYQQRGPAGTGDVRDVTLAEFWGGQQGTIPAREDKLIIWRWNNAGVCTESVYVFDFETGWTFAHLKSAENLAVGQS